MGKFDKLERQKRFGWVPQQRGLRYIVVNKETGEVVQHQVGIVKDAKTDPNIKTYIRVLKSLGYTVIPPKENKI